MTGSQADLDRHLDGLRGHVVQVLVGAVAMIVISLLYRHVVEAVFATLAAAFLGYVTWALTVAIRNLQ